MQTYRKIFLTLIFIILAGSPAYSEKFIPSQKIIKPSQIKAGSQGYMLTVLKGTKPTKIPVKVMSIVPQRPGKAISGEILIKFLGGYKIAKGMSGSPVYINGRLAGAVRSGWELSDHSLAMVTPIESMCAIFDNEGKSSLSKAITLPDLPFTGTEQAEEVAPDKGRFRGVNLSKLGGAFSTGYLTLTGMTINNEIKKFADSLGLELTQGVSMNSGGLRIDRSELSPGDAISALLVWGDVELSASGTVTATSKDGRFLAFGHDFMKRGAVNYPAAKTFVHETVNSVSFPFKLTSPTAINGTITQDREAGIGGMFNYFAPSIACEFTFKDIDSNTTQNFRFRVAADEFLTAKILEGILKGLAEEAWGRKGQGTMLITTHIDSRNINWSRRDIFFESDNIITKAFAQTVEIINAFMTQPFREIMPVGFNVIVEASQKPRALIIEDVNVPERASPGEEFEVIVTLRGWRTDPIKRKFTMKIPEDASGVCEVIVRGGSVQSMSQSSVDEGWKSINSLERMLTEIKALDAGNELITELNTDKLHNALKEAMRNNNKSRKLLTDEEEEYLSETKARRIKEGNLKIFSSEYFIDGLQKRVIDLE